METTRDKRMRPDISGLCVCVRERERESVEKVNTKHCMRF